jgi:hypothetical protein
MLRDGARVRTPLHVAGALLGPHHRVEALGVEVEHLRVVPGRREALEQPRQHCGAEALAQRMGVDDEDAH